MLKASIVGLTALLSSAFAQDSQCTSQGNDLGEILTGVDLNFVESIITCNNLGGLGPDDCPDRNIRYTNIGTDFGDGTTEPVIVDLVVTNLTLYEVNNNIRNGRTSLQTGQFGQVNLVDDYIADFKYEFFLTGTDIPVTFSNPFNVIFLDFDYGEAERLRESVIVRGGTSIATIEDACRDQNQPSPCLSTTVLIEQLGPTTFKATANVRGYGTDNADDLNQILQPVADMTQEEKYAADRYINITFPRGTSEFNVTYEITPSADPGFSGRNFQYALRGNAVANPTFGPCFFCDSGVTTGSTCAPCGTAVGDGSLPACPDGESYAPDCTNRTSLGCVPGSATYPACLDTCAVDCNADCEETVCFDNQCRRCGNIADGCGEGTACFNTQCGQGLGFDTPALCEASGCTPSPSPPPPSPPPPSPPPPSPSPPPPPPSPPPPSPPPPSPSPPPPSPPPPSPSPPPPPPSPPPPSPPPPSPSPPPPSPPPPSPSPPPPSPPPPSLPPRVPFGEPAAPPPPPSNPPSPPPPPPSPPPPSLPRPSPPPPTPPPPFPPNPEFVCFQNQCVFCGSAACPNPSPCFDICANTDGFTSLSQCEADCDKYVCFENSCRLCESAADECAIGGSGSCLEQCNNEIGFPTLNSCDASPCDKFICYNGGCTQCGNAAENCGPGSACQEECDKQVGFGTETECNAVPCEEYIQFGAGCRLCGAVSEQCGPASDCFNDCESKVGFTARPVCEAAPIVQVICFQNECKTCGEALDDCGPGTACNTACETGQNFFPDEATCANNADEPCEKHICFQNECRQCGNGADNCAAGSACATQCDLTVPGFSSNDQCVAGGCDKYACFNNQCTDCNSAACFGSSACTAACNSQIGFPTMDSCEVSDACDKFACFEGACTQCGAPGCAPGSACFASCQLTAGFATLDACEVSNSCDKYACYQGQCTLCGSAEADCAPGSACFAGCQLTAGFATLDACEVSNSCDKYACYQGQCTLCGSAEADCAPGSECFAGCEATDGFPTLASCEAVGCSEFVCFDYQCRECGSATDDCAAGSECFEQQCGQGLGSTTRDACNDKNCEKFVCEPDVTQLCYSCDSEYIRGLGTLTSHYCDDRTLYNKNGYNCQRACDPPVARKDPHLYLPHGGRADFRGAHNATFAMLSAKDVAFNVKVLEADFNWAKRVVHGTKMSAAYWVVRTSTGRLIKVEYDCASTTGAVVHESGHHDAYIRPNDPPLVIDDVEIFMAEAKKVVVSVEGKWMLSASISPFPFGNLAANKNKKLLDIEVKPLHDADHDVVAPHGIIGQAYDGDNIGVSGKLDKDRSVESTTTAQAEGAIEGVWKEYQLASPFSTDFKYSRFDATSAKPRDVSKLTGTKTPWGVKKQTVGATDLPEVN